MLMYMYMQNVYKFDICGRFTTSFSVVECGSNVEKDNGKTPRKMQGKMMLLSKS